MVQTLRSGAPAVNHKDMNHKNGNHKDYYQVLGVARHASADDIKKAYRRLVRKHHPDVSHARDADLKTKEINEAYAVLGDPVKRASYDAPGANMPGGGHFRPPPNWGAQGFGRQAGGQGGQGGFGAHAFNAQGAGGAGFATDDFFSDLFAQAGRRPGGGFARRGEDIHATITVALSDLYHLTTRTVTLQAGGMGLQERRVSITIPQGTLPGQTVRIKGQGQPGAQGGAPGDLLLEVQLRHDARYRVEGRDVIARLPVAPWEAALGAAIEVGTPSGQVSVTVPAGSQGGRKLRLKGRGIPASPAGDLYLELELVLPPATTARARAAYETMARELAFDPRARLRD